MEGRVEQVKEGRRKRIIGYMLARKERKCGEGKEGWRGHGEGVR